MLGDPIIGWASHGLHPSRPDLAGCLSFLDEFLETCRKTDKAEWITLTFSLGSPSMKCLLCISASLKMYFSRGLGTFLNSMFPPGIPWATAICSYTVARGRPLSLIVQSQYLGRCISARNLMGIWHSRETQFIGRFSVNGPVHSSEFPSDLHGFFMNGLLSHGQS